MSLSRILIGDALEQLRALPDGLARCCVTSPPYWGLRDYGEPGQIGLERTPEEYYSKLVAVFREVRRVLADDATFWLNLGDCYATGAGKVGDHPGGGEQGARWRGDVEDEKRGYRGDRLANGRGDQPAILRRKTRGLRDGSHAGKHTAIAAMGPMTQPNRMQIQGLKPKDMVGAPWRVAFALQADGWWLRSEIIWHKPNPMPESVKDRPTKSHEQLFLLSKNASYYYDAAAIAEPMVAPQASTPADLARAFSRRREMLPGSYQEDQEAGAEHELSIRNRRSVWTIPTQPFPDAHFATFPPDLVEPCILAGSALGDTILDPFAGAGTTGFVASRLNRNFVGIELNPKYAEMARRRIEQDAPLFNEVTA